MKKTLNVMSIFTLFSPVIPFVFYAELDSFNHISALRCFLIYLPFLLLCRFWGSVSSHIMLRLSGMRAMLMRIVIFLSGFIMALLPFLITMLYSARFYSIALALGGLSLYCFYTGRWGYGKDYRELAKPIILGVLFGASLYCYVGIALLNIDAAYIEFAHEIIVFSLLINGLFTAIIFNQANISRLLERRGGEQLIPKNLRFLNGAIVTVICGVIIICYLFREKAAEFLSAVVSVAVWIIASIARLFSIQGNGGAGLIRPLKFDTNMIRQGLVWEIVIMTILTALTVFFLWKFKRQILDWISDLIRRIIALLKRRENKRSEISKKIAYIDYIEEIIPVNRKQNKLKLDLKKYKKEKSPNKKLRLSYKIFIQWLKSKKIDILASDTAGESFEKGEEFYRESLDIMGKYKGKYEAVRYGGKNADKSGILLADEIVNQVKKN